MGLLDELNGAVYVNTSGTFSGTRQILSKLLHLNQVLWEHEEEAIHYLDNLSNISTRN